MKNQFNKLVLVAIFILTAGCSGQALVDSALSASTSEINRSLSLSVMHHGTEDETGNFPELGLEDGSKQFVTDTGVTVTLTTALLNWQGVTLLASSDDADCTAVADLTMAFAHVQNILEDDGVAQTLIESTLTDEGWCHFRVELAALAADSGLATEYPELSGKTFVFAGTWNDGSNSGEFSISTRHEVQPQIAFLSDEDGNVMEHPLHFHDVTPREVTVSLMYDRWFDGVDFTADSHTISHQVIENLESHCHQHMDGHLHHGEDEDSSDSHDHEDDSGHHH